MNHPEAPLEDGRCVCGHPQADCKPYDANICLYGPAISVTRREFPSGATSTTIRRSYGIETHLALPYHEGDLIDRLIFNSSDPRLAACFDHETTLEETQARERDAPAPNPGPPCTGEPTCDCWNCVPF